MPSFILGESKYIDLQVTSSKEQKIVITKATWELLYNGELLDRGTCEIIGNDLMQILLTPTRAGKLTLEVTYHIAPEIRKVRCMIDVD